MLGAQHCFRDWGAGKEIREQNKVSGGFLNIRKVIFRTSEAGCGHLSLRGSNWDAAGRLSNPTLARLPPRESSVFVEAVAGHQGC